jgi:signal peptide peptidase SppA
MQLPHIAARLYGTPLLIHRAKLDVILAVLSERIGITAPSAELALPAPRSAPVVPSGIAVIPIHGTLVKRTLGVDAASGLMSYAAIGAMLDAAVGDPQVAGILLDVDSPGGETGGVFELSEAVRAASAIKPVWAVANDSAFSAAYAIAASAQRVVVTRTGGVGSIGVIALHVDQSVADARDGLRYTAITAGARKNDYSPHEPLSTEAQARLQTEVNRLYELFVGHVSAMRGIPEDAVRATEAGLYFGPEGVAAGLADSIMSFDETLTEFIAFLTPQGRSRSPARAHSLVGCATHEEHPMNDESKEVIGVDEAAVLVAEARREITHSAQAIAELCLIAGCPDRAAAFIAEGKTEADVRQLLLMTKTANQSAEIRSTIDPDRVAAAGSPASPDNPLIMAVRHLTAKE